MEFWTKWLRQIGKIVIIVGGCVFMLVTFIARDYVSANQSTGLTASLISLYENAESSLYELRAYRLRKNKKFDDSTVLLAIDDISVKEVGRYPWTRTAYVKVLDRLNELGAKTVAFDILFPEPEKPRDGVSPDAEFAAAIKRFQGRPGNSVLLAYMLTHSPTDAYEAAPEEIYFNMINSQGSGGIPGAYNFVSRYDFPIEKLLATEASIGFINTQAEKAETSSGVLRFSPLVGDVEGVQPPTLALVAFQNLQKYDVRLHLQENKRQLQLLMNNKVQHSLEMNSNGETRLRYFGGPEAFPLVSVANLFADKTTIEKKYPGEQAYTEAELKEIFAGKMVFIGSTTTGAHDLRNTPIDTVLPGVYVHMNLFHMLKNQYFFKTLDQSFFWSISILMAGSLILFVVMQFGSPFMAALALVSIIGSMIAVDWYYFVPEGYLIKMLTCTLTWTMTYSWVTAIDFYREIQERKKIRGAFSRYVPPEVVAEVLADPSKLQLGGEKCDITMFFSDIRNFTNMSEKMSPQDLAKFLNIYMTRMTAEIFETNGTLDKYIGDAIVAFWGAPISMEDHAYRGCVAGLKMIEALPEINEQFEAQGLPTIDHGIGMNSGEVSVGNMGSDVIFAYTALGDQMNLAARVESLCKHYGSKLMITEFTYAKLGDKASEFITRPLDVVQVKGKSTGVKIIEIMHSFHPIRQMPEHLEMYCQAYDMFMNRDFQGALSKISMVLEVHPFDKASVRLRDACQHMIDNPPDENWAGVTVMTTK